MVHKIINNKYRVFIETLLLTILLLGAGFLAGYYVEFSRVDKAIDDSREFELEALDLKLQNYYYQIMDENSCEGAINQNFIFADDLYEEGLNLEKYEKANQISEAIKREKRRYVLLKTELWLNSILLKEKCGGENKTFHTVVYIYSDDKNNLAKKAEQSALSDILGKIKEEMGNEIILLPIAGDLDLHIVDLQKKIYGIGYFPSIIIDEEHVLRGFHSKEEIEQYLI
ncbi:MAG: hypothetical protein ABIH59_03195 [archaeon]